MKKEIMSPERLEASLGILDLTDSQNGPHVINLIVQKVKLALASTYTEATVEEIRTSPIVSVKENFDDLLFPEDNLGRSSRYTRYVSSDNILRTHTSAAVPSWLKRKVSEGISDTIIVLPGLCYRRDVVDKIHCGELNQMDVWRVKHGNTRFGRTDLIYLVETILNSIVPRYEYRANEVRHPYTVNGLEVEVLVNQSWLEVLECGEDSSFSA